MLPLSQSHLNLLDTCDRRYQYVFFDSLSGPSTYDQQLTTQWGSQFHLMMQQSALNLPVSVLAEASPEMTESMAALKRCAPEVFDYLSVDLSADLSADDADTATFSQSEHRRTLAFNDYLLTVVYDLLVIDDESGQIFDWKTHQRRPRKEWLIEDWQTRLYLYVLCETTHLKHEQLSMTYWFVRLQAQKGDIEIDSENASQPSFYRFGYSQEQHQQTYKDLMRLTDRLSSMRERNEFPKVPIEKGVCDRCPFAGRCDRATVTTSSRPLADLLADNVSSTAQLTDPQQLLRRASQVSADRVEEVPL